MKYVSVVVTILLLTSCSKDEAVGFTEARYTITVTGKWASPAFSVPAGAHYTTFVGMVHNGNATLWKEGTKASAGTELVAEIGNGSTMLVEIDAAIAAGNASSLLLFLAPGLTSAISSSLYCNSNYSMVSFASMLAPTPDWFVGVSGINLYTGNRWVQDTIINVYAYDAGTEEGDVFSSNNPPTVPQRNIEKLTTASATVLSNGNSSLGPVVTVRFTKQ